MLWYQLLPDGVICAYAAKGTPNAPPGYMQPTLRSIQKDLKANIDTDVTRAIDVTSILPIKCPRTNEPKKSISRTELNRLISVAFVTFMTMWQTIQ